MRLARGSLKTMEWSFSGCLFVQKMLASDWCFIFRLPFIFG